MQTKLTLKLDDSVIRNAKRHARRNHQSLSRIVDSYFRSLTTPKFKNSQKVPPVVASLIGVLKDRPSRDIKAEYTDYLIKKYS